MVQVLVTHYIAIVTGSASSSIEEMYFSFSKNSEVNQNELVGYYKTVQFVNNSKDKAKLFAVGTEVTENSK